MNKNLKIIAVVAFAFGLGLGFNNFAMSDVPSSYKVAVVDIPKLLESSTQVKALKNEQLKNRAELEKLANTATVDIEKQSTEENKIKLAKKYKELIAQKSKANSEKYTKELNAIDKKISGIINKKAKSSNYDLVLAKNNVLYGGDDITEEISKEVNKK